MTAAQFINMSREKAGVKDKLESFAFCLRWITSAYEPHCKSRKVGVCTFVVFVHVPHFDLIIIYTLSLNLGFFVINNYQYHNVHEISLCDIQVL